MKTKEIAAQYGINHKEFDNYLKSVGAGKSRFVEEEIYG